MDGQKDNLAYLKQLTDRLIEAEKDKAEVAQTLNKEARICEQTFDAIPDAIFITDTALVIIKVNKAFSDLMGLPKESLLGKRCFDIFACDLTNYCEQGKCIVQQVTEEKFEQVIKQSYSTRLDKWLDIRVSFVNHDINGFVHVLRDITAKVKLKQQLGESHGLTR
jgi:PAS domain S-box-containing protein